MPSYVLILSLIAVSLSIAIFLIFMRNEAPAPIFPENPSDIWDEPPATTAVASVRESNRILFRNSIERIQQKIHPIAIGALCNVLHDPSFEQLLDEILVFEDLNCKYVIELLEHTRELAIKEMEKNNDIYSPKRNELDEAGRLVIDELTIFITKLIEINCVEDVIKAAVIRELVINSRDDACRGLEISASVLSDFLGNMLNSETNDRTFPNWAVATTPAATTGMPTWGAATTAVATTPAATTGIPTWGAATTAVATQYSSNPEYYHCNQGIWDRGYGILQGTNEQRDMGYGIWDMGYGIDENEQIKYAMFFKDNTNENSKETSIRKILELLGGNVNIFSGYESFQKIEHPDVHFIVLNKTQLEILLSDNQSPILSIECPVVSSNDLSCAEIGCEEEAMYPRTFEKSRNLYYNRPTEPAATTGRPRFEDDNFHNIG